MATTKSTYRNKNHDDVSSSRKKVNTGDNNCVRPWSDLNHNVLYLVMMQLGVIDYLSFGGTCKSWRSLAISNRNTFMVSKPPMTMCISWRKHRKPCYLEDFEGRKFKTNLPLFAGGACVGLTCGYLIFFRRKTRDFWLVNPITRHEIHFTNYPIDCCSPFYYHFGMEDVRAILVFSLSIRGWVFLVMLKRSSELWFSTAGTGAWNHVCCTSLFTDLCAFKGVIYTLNFNLRTDLCQHLYELRLTPEPKLTSLETNNSLMPSQTAKLVSSGENIYVMDRIPPNGNIYTRDRTPEDRYRFQELDFGEMKWVLREKTMGEHASFLSNLKHGVADKTQRWEDSHGQGLLLGHNMGENLKLIELEKASSFSANMWYIPHECLNVDLIDE